MSADEEEREADAKPDDVSDAPEEEEGRDDATALDDEAAGRHRLRGR